MGKFLTAHGRKMDVIIVGESDRTYTIRLGKTATAQIQKDVLIETHILRASELDARYLAQTRSMVGEGGDIIAAARFAYIHGLTGPVHDLLQQASFNTN